MDELQSFLAANRKAANATLHPAQQALTLGSHWVQFVDIDQDPPLIQFGRVANPVDPDEKYAVLDGLAGGVMFGRAYTHREPDGEWGYTHKASVWPIGEALFLEAGAKGWNINALSEAGKVLLQLAYTQHRTHFLTTTGRLDALRDAVRAAITDNDTLDEQVEAILEAVNTHHHH